MGISPGFRDRLSGITCAERVLTEPADTWVYGYDNSRKHVPPDVVVFVTSHREVQDIVRLCHEQGVPIVARGRGTATTGAAIPVRGGVVLDADVEAIRARTHAAAKKLWELA
ncbi:MAG: FAD-binding protein [Pseudomonadota bacterium]